MYDFFYHGFPQALLALSGAICSFPDIVIYSEYGVYELYNIVHKVQSVPQPVFVFSFRTSSGSRFSSARFRKELQDKEEAEKTAAYATTEEEMLRVSIRKLFDSCCRWWKQFLEHFWRTNQRMLLWQRHRMNMDELMNHHLGFESDEGIGGHLFVFSFEFCLGYLLLLWFLASVELAFGFGGFCVLA